MKHRTGIRVAVWSSFVILLANIPYLYGYYLSTSEKIFMGDARTFIDTNSYLAWMHQASDGDLLFKNKYTTEPHSRIFFHPFFLILGRISHVTGLSLITVHTLARVLCGYGLLIFLYRFISFFIMDNFTKWFAYMVVSLSGGWGWLSLIPSFRSIPESWFLLGWVEGNTFLSIYALPLFSVSILLLLASFYYFLRSLEEDRISLAFVSGIITFFLLITHFFDTLIVYPVIALFIVVRVTIYQEPGRLRADLLKVVVLFITSVGAPLYDYGATLVNPVFYEHAFKEAITQSPAFIWFLGSFGLLLPLAVVGIVIVLTNLSTSTDRRGLFLVTWALAVPVLIYFPISFQRRLIEGAHVPVAILASMGCVFVIDKYNLNKKVMTFLAFLLLIPGNFTVLIQDMEKLSINKTIPSVAGFLERDIYDGIKWLETHTCREDTVLSDFEIGNYIPALSGNTVYVGHSPQTLRFLDKWQQVTTFFQEQTSPDQRRQFLEHNMIRYLFYCWRERSLGSFNPYGSDYLQPVYQNKLVTIFKVQVPETASE